jgi:hypothetical protein
MLTRLDAPHPQRNLADAWLRGPNPPARLWMVQCVLSRREAFGSVTVTTTSWHEADDEDEAKLLGMQAAGGHRPGYKLDLVIAKPIEPPG